MGSDWDYINTHMGGHDSDGLPNFMGDDDINNDDTSINSGEYKTLKEWNAIGRAVKKGEKGRYSSNKKAVVFNEEQTLKGWNFSIKENKDCNNYKEQHDLEKPAPNLDIMHDEKAYYILENFIARIEVSGMTLGHVTNIELQSLNYALSRINGINHSDSSSADDIKNEANTKKSMFENSRKIDLDFEDDIPF